MHIRFARLPQIALSLSLVACRDGTAPIGRPGHPTGTVSDAFTGFPGSLNGVQLTPANEIILTESDQNLLVRVDAHSGSRASIGVATDPLDVVVNRAGTLAFINCFTEGVINIVDLARNQFLAAIRLPATEIYRIVLSPDESRLFATSLFGDVFTVDLKSRTLGNSTQLAGSLLGLAIDHAGRHLYASSSAGSLSRIDAGSLVASQNVNIGCFAVDLALSIDDTELFVACNNGRLFVLDPTTLVTQSSIAVSGVPFALAISPDDEQVYVSSQTGGLTVIDRATRTVVNELFLGGSPRHVAFSSSGDVAYVANGAGRIDIIK